MGRLDRILQRQANNELCGTLHLHKDGRCGLAGSEKGPRLEHSVHERGSVTDSAGRICNAVCKYVI